MRISPLINLIYRTLLTKILGRPFAAMVCLFATLLVLLILTETWAVETVAIDGAVRYQTMDGFGTSSRVFDDPHVFNNFNSATGRAATVMTRAQQDEILDKLYTDLKLTRVRPASPDTAVGAGIEPVNDNNDPYASDLSKFDFSWKNLDDHIDYLSRARQRGAITSFLSPLSRESWMGTTTANDVAEYSEWMLAQVRRSADQGVRLPYLSIANEPSYSRNTMSGAFIRDVIKDLGPRLRAEGFDTMFVTPDDVRSSNGANKAQIILADPVARPYVGALATHLYDEPVSNVAQMKTLADQYQLPLWMTEFTVSAMGTTGLPEDAFSWASLMHNLISTYDVSAVDYLWGSFGEWEGSKTTLISLNNSDATYDGYTLNKPYYTMGQFSRFVEPGAVRIEATSSNNHVETTAYRSATELVIVAINTDSLSKEVTFGLGGLPEVTQFDLIRTSATENWVTLPSLAVNGSTFTATLPAGSIQTFIATLPPMLPGDFNGDRVVDGDDLTQWQGDFGANAESDADGDGDSDGADFLIWQRNYGSSILPPAVASVPEPACFSMLVFGMIALVLPGGGRILVFERWGRCLDNYSTLR